jgi:hypothetical protein
MGSIGDDDLGGVYAQIQCNRDETDCLCRYLEKELADIEAKRPKSPYIW